MDLVLPLERLAAARTGRVGGKALSLGRMLTAGLRVPGGVCLGTEVYRRFVQETGLQDKLAMELARKPFEQMRWEELWDASLRIQNLFFSTRLPGSLGDDLRDAVRRYFKEEPVAVRSSAPGEDSQRASFAGLHESFVQVSGTGAILEAIRGVWASLWSNRALLYFQELQLDPRQSAMAVVIQKMIDGERSGIAFGQSPLDPERAEIEAVYGLCQGLVDGQVEPDRWTLRARDGQVLSHAPARREHKLVSSGGTPALRPLSAEEAARQPLSPGELKRVYQQVRKAGELFQAPQDMEWTIRNDQLFVLQARPITTPAKEDDQRGWYLSLQSNFDRLQSLKESIQNEHLPAMRKESDRLAAVPLEKLDDGKLSEELESRARSVAHFRQVYHDEFIPFAHGMRLFGEWYNRRLKPGDPYEFTRLLARGELQSLRRNRMIEELGEMIRQDPSLARALENDAPTGRPDFDRAFESYLDEFGDPICLATECAGARAPSLDILLAYAAGSPGTVQGLGRTTEDLEDGYIEHFDQDERKFAGQLLEVARASWRLRDDDNIALGRIERGLQRACQEGASRHPAKALSQALDRQCPKEENHSEIQNYPPQVLGFEVRPRQLVGQPAGPGQARGPVRVIQRGEDLRKFRSGEILVCDAVDPNMTFVVPLALAVVERRGGMLIHGAIIAREYGLPCVTGIPEVTRLLKTGDQVTVDGHLGIVTLHPADPPSSSTDR